MIGLINNSYLEFLSINYGQDAVEKILDVAGLPPDTLNTGFVSSCPYADDILLDGIMGAAERVLDVERDQLNRSYGRYWITSHRSSAYQKLLGCLGGTFVDFMRALNGLHLHISLGLPGFLAPEFLVEDVTSTSLTLHYFSLRPGLHVWVEGMVEELAKVIFELEIDMQLLRGRQLGNCDHEVYGISFPAVTMHRSDVQVKLQADDSRVGLAPETFYHLHPFHFVVDMDLRLIQAGSALSRLVPELATPGCLVSDYLQILHPRVPWDLEHQLQYQWSSKLIISTNKGLELTGGLYKVPHVSRGPDGKLQEGKDVVLFLGTPRISNLDELKRHDLSMSDFPSHDMAAEFVLLAEHRQVEHDLKEQYEVQTLDLQAVTGRLQQERWRAEQDNMLLKRTLVRTLQTHDSAVGRPTLDTNAPADLTLKLLDRIIVGEPVDIHQVLEVRNALLNSGTNLWQPRAMNAQALGQVLGKAGDDEVMRALEQLLVARHQDDDDAWSLSSVTDVSESNSQALPTGEHCYGHDSVASGTVTSGRHVGRARLSVGSGASDLLPPPGPPTGRGTRRSLEGLYRPNASGSTGTVTPSRGMSGGGTPSSASATVATVAVTIAADGSGKDGRARVSSQRTTRSSSRHSAPTINAQVLLSHASTHTANQDSGCSASSTRRASMPERVPLACPYADAHQPQACAAPAPTRRAPLAAIESADEVFAAALQDALLHNPGQDAPLQGVPEAVSSAAGHSPPAATRAPPAVAGATMPATATAVAAVSVPSARPTSPAATPAGTCHSERSHVGAAPVCSGADLALPHKYVVTKRSARSGLLRQLSARLACGSAINEGSEGSGSTAQHDSSCPTTPRKQQQPFLAKLKTLMRRASSSLSMHKSSAAEPHQPTAQPPAAAAPPPQLLPPAAAAAATTPPAQTSARTASSVEASAKPLSTIPSPRAPGAELDPAECAACHAVAVGVEPATPGTAALVTRTSSGSCATQAARTKAARTKAAVKQLLDRSQSAHVHAARRSASATAADAGAHAQNARAGVPAPTSRSAASCSSGNSTPIATAAATSGSIAVVCPASGAPRGVSQSLGLLLGSSQPEGCRDALVLSRPSPEYPTSGPLRSRPEDDDGPHVLSLSPLCSSTARRTHASSHWGAAALATTSTGAPSAWGRSSFDAGAGASSERGNAMQARNVELSSLVSRRGSVGGDVSPWGKVSSPLGQSGEPPTARLSGSTALTRSTGQGAVTAAAAAAAAAGAKQSASAALLQLVDNPTDQLTMALKGVEEWQYDSFALDSATSGRPLSCLAYFLLRQSNLIRKFHLNELKLVRFLMRIEDGYPQHPYHSRIHAADVLRSLHMLLTVGGVVSSLSHRSSSHRNQPVELHADKLDKQESAQGDVVWRTRLLACYLAAICHDYEHRGVNNDYLVRTGDSLALLYNDRSPMENHHVAAAFTLMKDGQYAFMQEVSKKVQDVVRKDVVELVLSTDMKQHFSLTGIFSAKLAAALGASAAAQGSGELLLVWDEEMQMLALKMALKAADLGHLTSKPEVHKQWVSRLEEEMFRQGDRERALGQPVSALMDRRKEGVTRSQSGFFNIVAIPMYKALAQAFPETNPMYQNALSNLNMWMEKEAAAAAAAGPGAT